MAGGTSLLNSLNEGDSVLETLYSLGNNLCFSAIAQMAGYKVGGFLSNASRSTTQIITMGDIVSAAWSIPAIKVGVTRFFSGLFGAIINDFGR